MCSLSALDVGADHSNRFQVFFLPQQNALMTGRRRAAAAGIYQGLTTLGSPLFRAGAS
jgi:hypothetical protein